MWVRKSDWLLLRKHNEIWRQNAVGLKSSTQKPNKRVTCVCGCWWTAGGSWITLCNPSCFFHILWKPQNFPPYWQTISYSSIWKVKYKMWSFCEHLRMESRWVYPGSDAKSVYRSLLTVRSFTICEHAKMKHSFEDKRRKYKTPEMLWSKNFHLDFYGA